MLFPEKLRQLRAESGLKQKDIAKKIGVDIPMYSRFEHGERRPKRETVVKLAKIYGTDVEQLVALWLAFAALNEIGTDKLAERAYRGTCACGSGTSTEIPHRNTHYRPSKAEHRDAAWRQPFSTIL